MTPDYEKRIQSLEKELDEARFDIISLAPYEFRLTLRSFMSLESWEDYDNWLSDSVETFIEQAKQIGTAGTFAFGVRGNCPLCGSGAKPPNDDGFSLPEGLRRHLTGRQPASQCAVTLAASKLAQKWNREIFAEAAKTSKIAEQLELKERRKIEMLFLLAPNKEPKLIDEGMISAARSSAELAYAEERLAMLDFEKKVEGNITSYIHTNNDFDVYADPRWPGRIDFHVYTKSTAGRRFANLTSFFLRDDWKTDISGKFQKRLMKAIERSSSKVRYS